MENPLSNTTDLPTGEAMVFDCYWELTWDWSHHAGWFLWLFTGLWEVIAVPPADLPWFTFTAHSCSLGAVEAEEGNSQHRSPFPVLFPHPIAVGSPTWHCGGRERLQSPAALGNHSRATEISPHNADQPHSQHFFPGKKIFTVQMKLFADGCVGIHSFSAPKSVQIYCG
ncbi:uncharacterized protein ACIB01_003840 [Guaruba guarouba]